MGRLDRLIVPGTFLVALAAVLLVTISWVPHPVQLIGLRVQVGPPGVVPRHLYGLRFTPRNPLSGHILTSLVPSQRPCVDVTVTNQSLTYIDQLKPCRLKDGSYMTPYRFPRVDDYIIFVEMHPVGGLDDTWRQWFPLDLCWLRRDQHWHGYCPPHPALLRGLEVVRSHTVDGLTVVLGAPAHAVRIEQNVQVSFLFLRHGHAVTDLEPIGGEPGRAVAISMDTQHFTHLHPDSGQVAGGYVKGGAVSFSGWFGRPSIYRVFGFFEYHGHPLQTSFVIDVNPAPTPTPSAQGS